MCELISHSTEHQGSESSKIVAFRTRRSMNNYYMRQECEQETGRSKNARTAHIRHIRHFLCGNGILRKQEDEDIALMGEAPVKYDTTATEIKGNRQRRRQMGKNNLKSVGRLVEGAGRSEITKTKCESSSAPDKTALHAASATMGAVWPPLAAVGVKVCQRSLKRTSR